MTSTQNVPAPLYLAMMFAVTSAAACGSARSAPEQTYQTGAETTSFALTRALVEQVTVGHDPTWQKLQDGAWEHPLSESRGKVRIFVGHEGMVQALAQARMDRDQVQEEFARSNDDVSVRLRLDKIAERIRKLEETTVGPSAGDTASLTKTGIVSCVAGSNVYKYTPVVEIFAYVAQGHATASVSEDIEGFGPPDPRPHGSVYAQSYVFPTSGGTPRIDSRYMTDADTDRWDRDKEYLAVRTRASACTVRNGCKLHAFAMVTSCRFLAVQLDGNCPTDDFSPPSYCGELGPEGP